MSQQTERFRAEHAARRRRRLARPPCLPRAAEVDSRRRRAAGERARRLRATSCCASGTPSSRRRSSSAGTRSTCRPTGTRRCPTTSPAASSTTAILEQLDALPALVESFGFACAKAAGYEADDFLAAAAARWNGPVVVATSDRDAFQLVSDRVSILQPVKGVSELARIGPAEVRERYGVDPSRSPTSSRCAATPRTASPARPASGPKTAAALLAAVRHARGGARRGPLLDDRRRPAPLPADRADGRRCAAAEARSARSRTGRAPPRRRRELGLERARRPARRARLSEAVDESSATRRFATLHPTGGHPESQAPDRGAARAVLLTSSASRRPRRTSCAATRRRSSSASARARGWLDGDTICTETTFEAALLAAGAAIEAVRRGGFALARPPGHHAEPGAGDGLLHLRLGRDRRPLGPGGARARARGDPRLGRAPRQRHAGRSSATTRRSSSSRCTSGRSIPARGGPDEQGETLAEHPARRPAPATTRYLAAFERAEERDRGVRAGAAARLGRLRRARRRSARGARADRPTRSRELAAPRVARSLRASRPCSRAATTSRRCPRSSRPRSRASAAAEPRRRSAAGGRTPSGARRSARAARGRGPSARRSAAPGSLRRGPKRCLTSPGDRRYAAG